MNLKIDKFQMIHLREKNINHAYMRLNLEQALTPMERDLGVDSDSSQKSSRHSSEKTRQHHFAAI